MRDMRNVVDGLKPIVLMVAMQISFTGANVLFKMVINDGMNIRITIAYRFVFATAFMVPLALLLERGVLSQNLYFEALALTSATFASALSNFGPVATFLIALCFRTEKLNLGTVAGKAKIIGTLTGVGGAMILTFYRGPQIDTGSARVDLLHHHDDGHVASSSAGNTVFGALCALGSTFCTALWLNVQTKMSERYPSHYSSAALISVMGTLVSLVFGLSLERDWSQWKLGWNVRLLTVAYCGILVSGVMVVVTAWCVNVRGPLFPSVFGPLLPLMVAIVGPFMLDEKLHLGIMIGGVLIVCGLYVVLWGKGKEMKKTKKLVPSQNLPLVSGTVEILVKSPVGDKDNLNNDINGAEHHDDVANVVRDRESPSEKK